MAAVQSGCAGDDLQEIAALGNYGKNASHIASQMERKFCQSPDIDLPSPYLLECPVKVVTSDGLSTSQKRIGMFLPHEWFHWMSSYPHISGLDSLEAFWESHSAEDPQLFGNPVMELGIAFAAVFMVLVSYLSSMHVIVPFMLPSQETREKFLPLCLHGDAGAFQKNDSIHVISMRSLLSRQNVATAQLLLLALPKGAISKCPGDPSSSTMHHVWSVIKWSFEAAYFNKFPEADHMGKAWPQHSWRSKMAGQPLNSDGHSALLFAIQGDAEYLQNEYGLTLASHESMCFHCGANRSDCPFNDFRPGALWRATMVSHAGTCPTEHMVSGISGVTGDTFKFDILHTLEEGLTAHCLANCAFDWVLRSAWPGTQDVRLRDLFGKISKHYNELGIDSENRIRRFPMSAFCNVKAKWDNFPSLSGIKAKQCRWLVPVFLEICEEFKDADSYSQHKYQCLKHLNMVYDIMDRAGLHPSTTDAKAFRKSLDSCLLHYSRLSVISMESGVLMWNTIPKMHWAQHLGLLFRWLNPKFYSCYQGETMVGHMSALGHACLNGIAAHQVPLKVCWRFRLAFHLRNQGADFAFAASDSDA